jgi:hypothetical protein
MQFKMIRLKSISKGCFQVNPDYELLPIPSPSSELTQSFAGTNTKIVIRSQSSGATKLACSATTSLLMLLQKGESIAGVFDQSKSLETILARLVLDKVLLILWNDQFVGGPSAWPALFVDEHLEANDSTLSTAALRYAQALRLKDSLQLSRRLYTYNCVPITHFWRNRFSNCETIIQFLGASPVEKTLIQNRGWLAWQAKNWQWQANKPLYKLYLSPQMIALQECWQMALPIFAESKAVGLKIGADAYGLLRPDKIVAHFESQEALLATADELEKVLVGFPSQGVPFTALLGNSGGLLSWGVDLPSMSQGSWRSWLTDNLATAMIAASEVNLPVEPWQYARERLGLEGINTKDWTPTPELLL